MEESERRDEEELTDTQRAAVAALSFGHSREEAAMAAGVSERTVYRWLHEAGFRQALNRMRADAWTETTGYLQSRNRDAAKVLEEVMKDPKARGWERVHAAKVLLEMSRKAVDTDLVHARLDEVERKLEEASAGER
jgi:hypothetical protein